MWAATLCLWSLCPAWQADHEKRTDGYRPNACGPVALLVVCRWHRMEATLDELEKLCGTTAAGTTMDGLVRAAAKKGLQPNARKANLAFLKQQAGPVIIDCPRGHYCVLIGWKDGRALVYDPPSPARWVSEAELQVNWTGHVLWFARKP